MSQHLEQESSRIFCHRGIWDASVPQNSLTSFNSAQMNGMSIETDIRFFIDQVVIEHDLPKASSILMASNLFDYNVTFALNLKEDGLQFFFEEAREWLDSTKSFVFDGSIPQMLQYSKLGIRHAMRLSEYELDLNWNPKIIWLDSFESDWWLNDQRIESKIEGSEVIVVSPELHGRDPRAVWDFLAKERQHGRFNLSICTDRPLEFKAWI